MHPLRFAWVGLVGLALCASLGCQGFAPGGALAPGTIPGAYWFGRIVPVATGGPDDEMARPWKRGAYLHLREDGRIGFNESEPGAYVYRDADRWTLDENVLTLAISGARYAFDLDSPNPPLTALRDPGGAFEMSLRPRQPSER